MERRKGIGIIKKEKDNVRIEKMKGVKKELM